MIKLDISNVWGQLSLPELLESEQEVFKAHKLLTQSQIGRAVQQECRDRPRMPSSA